MKYLARLSPFITAVTIILFFAEVSHSGGQAMPLTRDNIESCVMRTQLAIESVSAEDQARMNGNNAYASQVIKRIAVSPIEMSGYDYNMTVKALADVIAQGRLPEDVAHKKGMLFLFLTIAQSSDHLLAYKFITTDTKLSINNALSH